MIYQPLAAIKQAESYLNCLLDDGIQTEDFLNYIMPANNPNMLADFIKTGTNSAKMTQSILAKHKPDYAKANSTLLSLCNLYGWMQNKQVYQPDNDFLELLLETPLMSFNYQSLRNMPYKNIYIDISSASNEIHGAFVYISEITDVSIIDIILVKPDNSLQHSYYLVNHMENEYHLQEVPKRDISQEIMSIWQMFLYLCSENANVEKNQETEKTYHPGKTIKNKFSEIRKWDVGIRIGSSIRQYKKDTEQDNKTTHTINHRKSPRPHMRKAHWHKYMTGKGRKIPVIRWIEPTFVLTKSCENLPVTVHPVV